jgi:predicted GNAT superfamily acetyltransferase
VNYEIRDLSKAQEMVALEQLQRDAWGWSDLDIVNSTMLKAVSYAGGVVAAAYPNKATHPVGFVSGLTAWHESKLWHHSDLLAVHPDHRGTGLALALKHHQRKCVLAQGITRMTWTFDPLIARNARFNFHKLGARATSYQRDWYGDMGGVNSGLANDRLIAEWNLYKAEAYTPTQSNFETDDTVLRADHHHTLARPFTLGAVRESPLTSTVWLEIPRDIETLKHQDKELAQAWREVTRVALEHYLTNGYEVSDFVILEGKGFYKLTKMT